MTTAEILSWLREKGSASTVNTYRNHGAAGEIYGVKIGDMKVLLKQIKKQTELAPELYRTGVHDAMYLAGLLADAKSMSKEELQYWAKHAHWYMLSEYTVAWVAAESRYGWELAMEWIRDKEEMIQCAGWSTLAGIVSLKADEELDIDTLSKLLDEVQKTIHSAMNRVCYSMNNFVICTGAYVKPLHEKAKAVAKAIGIVEVHLGNTACKVPFAPEYIEKSAAHSQFKKKKTVKC